jgi:hypothetical protein
MADGPTASKTLGMIGVQLVRLQVESVTAINMSFVAVQTDWKWAAWYWFENSSLIEDFMKIVNGAAVSISDRWGTGFGSSDNGFRREYLHLTKAMSVDGLAGDFNKPIPALLHAVSRKGHVFVTIDIKRPDGVLQLRKMQLKGSIPKEFDGKGIRGTVSLYTRAHIYQKQKELTHPPLAWDFAWSRL